MKLLSVPIQVFVFRNITYVNGKGSFIDDHTVLSVNKKGKEKALRGKNIVIAVGGRPKYPQVSFYQPKLYIY